MKIYTKRLPIFVLVLALILSLTSFHAYTWIGGFHSVVNFTSINSMATYNSIAIGNANYIYLNLTGTIPNGELGYVWLTGYNSANVFVGNVTAFPYSNGLLASLKTTTDSSYNTLYLFFNQSLIQNTWYYSGYNSSKANIPIANYTLATRYNNYVAYFNPSKYFPFNLYSYLLPSFQLVSCMANNFTAPTLDTCTFTFKPNQAFYFFETNNYIKQNVSLNYITPSGTLNYTLYATNTLLTLIDRGIPTCDFYIFLCHNNTKILTQPSTTPISMVINSTNYYLLSNGIGIYSNAIMFNSLTTNTSVISVPFKNNYALLSITTPFVSNTTFTTFVLIPTYTTQYTKGSIINNATFSTYAFPTGCDYSNGFCYKYKFLISNLTWDYYYNGSNLFNFSNIVGSNIIRVHDVNFTILNIGYYSDMGNNCNNVYMEAYNPNSQTDLGEAYFYTLNCSKGKFLVYYNSSKGQTYYNDLYLYMGSTRKLSSYSNSGVVNKWYIAENSQANGIPINSIIETYDSSSKLPSVMLTGSRINFTYNSEYGIKGISSGLWGGAYTFGGEHLNSTYADTNFFVFFTGSKLSILSSHIGILNNYNSKSYILNTTQNKIRTVGTSYGTANFIMQNSNYADVIRLYSSNYTNGSAEYASFPPTTTISQSQSIIVLPNSSVSGFDLTNASIFGNHTKFIKNTAGSVYIIGITVPIYAVISFAIVEIIFIIISIALNEEILFILNLIMLWFTNLLSVIGNKFNNNYVLTIIAIIITLYYVIKKAPSWFRK